MNFLLHLKYIFKKIMLNFFSYPQIALFFEFLECSTTTFTVNCLYFISQMRSVDLIRQIYFLHSPIDVQINCICTSITSCTIRMFWICSRTWSLVNGWSCRLKWIKKKLANFFFKLCLCVVHCSNYICQLKYFGKYLVEKFLQIYM